MDWPTLAALPCPICDAQASALDVVDFQSACLLVDGHPLPPSGHAVYYFMCDACQFAFCPEIAAWSKAEFLERIYNDRYVQLDPEYVEARPKANARLLHHAFGDARARIRHLDWGGGDGQLARLLCDRGWNSTSVDPLATEDDASPQGRFDLVTAFEVFEHVPDPRHMMEQIVGHVAEDGLILFSTRVSDGHIRRGARIDWWYCAPRNGHISLYSSESLSLLGDSFGLRFASFSESMHCFARQVPGWAEHLFSDDRETAGRSPF